MNMLLVTLNLAIVLLWCSMVGRRLYLAKKTGVEVGAVLRASINGMLTTIMVLAGIGVFFAIWFRFDTYLLEALRASGWIR